MIRGRRILVAGKVCSVRVEKHTRERSVDLMEKWYAIANDGTFNVAEGRGHTLADAFAQLEQKIGEDEEA